MVELLVVISIMVFIVSITIVYSGQGRNQVALTVESAKVAGLIMQAKQLAIATYGVGATLSCGYGMYFDEKNQDYSLFIYSPKGATVCPGITTIESSTWKWSTDDMVEYSAEAWDVPLARGLVLATSSANPDAEVVLFYPPNPVTLMVRASDGVHFETAAPSFVNIQTVDGLASSSISISPAGQVNF